jgi:Cohesin domain
MFHHFTKKAIQNYLVGSFVVAVLFLLQSAVALAADLVVSPSAGNYTPGQTFTVAVRVSPGGQSINAVEASLKYDPAVLSVVSVSKTGSALTLWTTEPTSAGGVINFGGGSPSPITAQSNLVSVTFKAVAAGTGGLSVTKATVTAADGKGTDVYTKSTDGLFTIAAAPVPTTPTEPTPVPTKPATDTTKPATDEKKKDDSIIFGDPPRAPEIGSQVFVDAEKWYNIKEGLFTLTLPFDVNEIAVMLATSSDNQPDTVKAAIQNPPTEEFAIKKDAVEDGVHYVSIKYKNQVGWGAVLNRKVLIDTTPPKEFTIDVRISNSPSGFPQLNFAAEDETSGIDYYEMTIADKEPLKITPDEAKVGYLLKELEDGTYTIKVMAYDKAGNKRESSVAVQITAGWKKPVDVVVETSVWDYFTTRNIVTSLLLLIIVFQFAYIWYDRKQNKLREDKLRRETRDIQDQMEKIFSALRDEIYDQINLITKRPRLSKKEKEAVEGLNQALEVSETLIEKEINDVKTILK